MKKLKGKAVLAGVLGLVLVVFTISCASTGTRGAAGEEGFLGKYAMDLQPGPEGGVEMRWLKPGVDFAKYNKLMVDSIVFFFAADSEYKGIDPEDLKQIADSANKQLVETLQGKYPIVAEPEADVLRMRFAITDLKQSRPVLSAITSVMPVGLGISIIKKGATGSWTGSGATSAEFMAIDSATNDVIAVARDKRTAGFTERFSKWGSVEDAFKFWAERLKLFLDTAHGAKQ